MKNSAQKLAEHAATNAAGICSHLAPVKLDAMRADVDFDAVTLSAVRLAQIETRAGFNWEEQRNDWESVCSRIADYLTNTSRAPAPESIRRFINRN